MRVEYSGRSVQVTLWHPGVWLRSAGHSARPYARIPGSSASKPVSVMRRRDGADGRIQIDGRIAERIMGVLVRRSLRLHTRALIV